MADAEDKGLNLRLEAAERNMLAWKETALTATRDLGSLQEQLAMARFERNLLRRERKALSLTIRRVADNGADITELLDLLASLAQAPREGEGLLAEDDTDG